VSDTAEGPGWWLASDGRWYPPAAPAGGASVTPYGAGGGGPIGRRENLWLQLLFALLTCGLYGIYWAYKSHEEIKVHTGEGVGGVVGALIYTFAGFVTLFLLPIEIQKMYERDGKASPVSAVSALWVLLLVIPWYVVCQRALNDYWESKGAPAP
jgi:hypothetical protein